MSDEQPSAGADIALELGGQKVNVKNIKSLNTIVTILTLVVVCAGGAWIYKSLDAHAMQSKDAGAALVGALKEQTQVMREQVQAQREGNCLQTYQGPVTEKGSFCRQIAR